MVKMNEIKKKGFTILELVIAIFLLAVVIGTALLIMASNLNVIDKSNDIVVANALIQHTVEDIYNIEYPPVYYDRQDDFGDRPLDEDDNDLYKEPEDIDLLTDGDDHMPADFPDEIKNKYILKKYDFRYDDNDLLTDATDGDTDKTVKHRIDIYVLRKSDKAVLLEEHILISRDGL
ncbi:MAG: prepilin-type N-terminal cleavage/methylation domain-containing protein [Elusimicrobia bacterium]|nr:prepilin-type N-terminal cleavage/methylation domain-containing protein [Elusimicrobiota bacterium]